MMKKVLFSFVMMSLLAALSAGPAYAVDVVRLSPEKVVELAKTQSVAVRASEYNVKAQENAVKSAATGFLPTVSGSLSALHIYDKAQFEFAFPSSGPPSSVPPGLDHGDSAVLGYFGGILAPLSNLSNNFKIATPNNLYNGSFSVAQPIFAGGRIINGYRATKFNFEAQKYTHSRTVTEIGLSAQTLFWGYVGAVKSLEAVHETRQWFETLLKDQQKMFEKGLIIELDVLNTKIEVDNFKLTEEKLNNSIRTLSDQILLFLGLKQGSVIDADTAMLASVGSTPPAAPTDSVEQWLASREDLLAMKSQIRALHAMKGLQLGSYLPNIAAFGSYGATNQYSIMEGAFQKSSSVGAQLSWTLIDWGKAWRDAQKTQCQLLAAQLQADNVRDQIRLTYFDLARKVDEAGKACAIAKEDLETAQKALTIAKLKYDAQAITNTELLNARNQLTGKMVAYAQARINVILAVEEFKVAPFSGAGSQSMQGGGVSGMDATGTQQQNGSTPPAGGGGAMGGGTLGGMGGGSLGGMSGGMGQ